MAALTQRSHARAVETLGTPSGQADALKCIAAYFRTAFTVGDRMCLCGVLAAERDALPPEWPRPRPLSRRSKGR